MESSLPCLFRSLISVVCLSACASVRAEVGADQADLGAWAWSSPPLVSVLTRESGLPQSAVSSVTQTASKFLWVGTYNGLARFDGQNFDIFNQAKWPEMKSGRVTALFEDSWGNLWVGAETGDLMVVTDDGAAAKAMPRHWSSRAVTSIRESSDGELWLLLANGELVRRRDGRSWRVQSENVRTPDVPRMTADFDGRVWVLGGDQRLQYLENDELRTWQAPEGEPIYTTTFVGRSRKGGVWIVANGVVRRWKDGEWQENRGPHPMGAAFNSAFHENSDGTLVFGVIRAGLVMMSPSGEKRSITMEDGLTSDWVTDIVEDNERNIWVATVGGLNQLRIGRAEMVARWGAAAVLGLDTDEEGALWAGTEGAGLHRLQNGTTTSFLEGTGLTKPYVWAVEAEPDGTVWAGTWGQGLFRGRDGQFMIAPGWDTSALTVTAVLRAGDGALWVGCNLGVARYQEGKWTWWREASGRLVQNVRCLAEDGRGGLWFGTSGDGLGHIAGETVTFYGEAEGLPNGYVWALLPDQDGLWAGTAGGGLVRLERGRFSGFRPNAGFPSQTICGLARAKDGRIWMSSYGGVFSFPELELSRALRNGSAVAGGRFVDVSDGLATPECSGGMQRAMLIDSEGVLWVATARGLARIDTSEREAPEVPRALIREVWLDDSPASVDAQNVLRVPPGFHRVELKVAALRFSSPHRVEFRHRLIGFSPEWVASGRALQFNYLPPGRYTLEVAARDHGGEWRGEMAKLEIVAEPYFWQRVSVQVAFGAIMVCGTALIARTSVHRRARRRLDQLERDHAVERERTRIAQDLHDDLGASLTRLNLLTQASSNPGEGDASRNLADIRKVAVEITRSMDEVVWAANPRHDTLESLVAYLARFAQEMASAAGLRCRLRLPLDVPDMALTAEFRHNLFLATKETLHNVVRHAKATEMQIRLECDTKAGKLLLSIVDDGVGFDAAARLAESGPRPGQAHGNGLAGLRRRLAQLGGRFDIVSSPGAGTCVSFEVPLPAD